MQEVGDLGSPRLAGQRRVAGSGRGFRGGSQEKDHHADKEEEGCDQRGAVEGDPTVLEPATRHIVVMRCGALMGDFLFFLKYLSLMGERPDAGEVP